MSDGQSKPSSTISTWQEAEHAAAGHMRETLMFSYVRLSNPGADNGIDVHAREGIAQVKWYASPVGIADVQRLRGTASNTQWAVFYASIRGYTKAAKEAATNGNVALFVVLASGLVLPSNHVAESLMRLRLGLPLATNPNGELTMGELFASRRRTWSLDAAIRPFEERVEKLMSAIDFMEMELSSLGRHEPQAAEEMRRSEHAWLQEARLPAIDEARIAFERAVDWRRQGVDWSAGGVRAEILVKEAALPKLPALVEALIDSVPIPRAELNDWCDRWTEERHQAWFRPRRVMPQDPELRERLERIYAQGPSRENLERHAKTMAIRVVV
jgi:hypothetical protein